MLETPPRAMILAAGFGSRLGALSDQRPKPMLEVCGTPLVRWCVLWLRHHGVREIVVNLHHKGDLIEHELGDGSALGVSIAYSREDVILGTGGGLRQARPLLDDGSARPIVVVNGKLLVDLDLPAALAFHAECQAEATMVLRLDRERVWGAGFGVDTTGRIIEFLGEPGQRFGRDLDATDKPQEGASPPSAAHLGSPATDPLMFSGIHILSPRFLDRIPAEGSPCVVRTAYTELFHQRGALFGFRHDGYWWEHSTVERYLQGVRNILDGHVALPFREHLLSGIDRHARVHESARIVEPVWIGPDAHIDRGAVVGPYTQLGAASSVAEGCEVARSIVWPGVRVEESCADTVVTS